MNTWPRGRREALDQSEHESWNAKHYPGTRQLCVRCDEPTGRCEEDSIYRNDEGPLCEACALLSEAIENEHTSKGMSWQPIDTAPRNKTMVALLRVDGARSYGIGWYMPMDGWQGWEYTSPPTHWAPLPEPPNDR